MLLKCSDDTVLEDLWASWLFRPRWRGIFIRGVAIVNPKKTVYSRAFSRSKHPSSGYRFPEFQCAYIPFLDSALNLNEIGGTEINTFRRAFRQDWNSVQFENRSKVRRSLKLDTSRLCAASLVHSKAGTFLHNLQEDSWVYPQELISSFCNFLIFYVE